jgi:hypothetical protein
MREAFPDLSRAHRAVARVLAHGEQKRPGRGDAWLSRHHLRDLEAALRHLGRALVDPSSRDESGELHLAHVAARVLLALERMERR